MAGTGDAEDKRKVEMGGRSLMMKNRFREETKTEIRKAGDRNKEK